LKSKRNCFPEFDFIKEASMGLIPQ